MDVDAYDNKTKPIPITYEICLGCGEKMEIQPNPFGLEGVAMKGYCGKRCFMDVQGLRENKYWSPPKGDRWKRHTFPNPNWKDETIEKFVNECGISVYFLKRAVWHEVKYLQVIPKDFFSVINFFCSHFSFLFNDDQI